MNRSDLVGHVLHAGFFIEVGRLPIGPHPLHDFGGGFVLAVLEIVAGRLLGQRFDLIAKVMGSAFVALETTRE